MRIEIIAFNKDKYFDIAVDTDNEVFLLGIPFNYGPAEHTKYYRISKKEFELGKASPTNLNHLVDGQNFKGDGELYYSTCTLFK